MKKTYTTKEVCSKFGISRRRLYDYVSGRSMMLVPLRDYDWHIVEGRMQRVFFATAIKKILEARKK